MPSKLTRSSSELREIQILQGLINVGSKDTLLLTLYALCCVSAYFPCRVCVVAASLPI
jgi:hypothetical protein